LAIPEQYRTSGRIVKEVKPLAEAAVKPGSTYLEVCDLVKREVESRGSTAG
jgi:methionine aminopeptidase